MVEGVPPPWLLNMQRYGPPPAYPNLKIPGLNAPIPEGASFGYHPGGWGKPPVDEVLVACYFNAESDYDLSDWSSTLRGCLWKSRRDEDLGTKMIDIVDQR